MPASEGNHPDDHDHEHAHEYPPAEWSVEELTAALEESDENPPIPTYEDSDVWATIRDDAVLGSVLDALRAEADGYRAGDVPRIGARQFKRVAATGRKSAAYYETLRCGRRSPTVLARRKRRRAPGRTRGPTDRGGVASGDGHPPPKRDSRETAPPDQL